MTNKPRLVVFSGSGISAESGIATFRDDGGVWEKYKIEDVCTTEALRTNRAQVFEFFNAARKAMTAAQPNEAHKLIAEMEKHFDVTVVTQNIDDLHERAGSTNVIHLHGEITKMRNERDDEIVPNNRDIDVKGQFRPHVVMYGEMPFNYEAAEQACEAAEYGIVVGSSLQVYPAAGLVYRFNITTPVILVDPNPPINELTYPNVTVVKEIATTGMAMAMNLLLNDVNKSSRIQFNEM